MAAIEHRFTPPPPPRRPETGHFFGDPYRQSTHLVTDQCWYLQITEIIFIHRYISGKIKIGTKKRQAVFLTEK